MQLKLPLLSLLFVFLFSNFSFAQLKDSTPKITDTVAAKTTPPTATKIKEIKKIDDALLALPQELIYRLKKMTPNQLLVISERFVRNEKRVDDNGENYEVTVTVRLGFSQDMITGIVKEVPLYQSTERETNIISVKIPVQFCCTTPIDTIHKKQHCGKMSELNDLEDNEHCKDWAQKDEAQAEAENTAGFGKTGGSKTTGKKKGGDVTGKTSATDDGFGKPVPKGKPSKKGKNSKGQVEEETNTDSTSAATKPPIVSSKDKGKNEKTEKADKDKKTAPETEEGFGKPQPKEKSKKKSNDKKPVTKDDGYGVPNYKEETNDDSTKTEKKEPVKTKESKKKESKKEESKKQTAKDEGFGKPVTKEETKADETSKDSSAAENKEPVKSTDKKSKKKKG